MWHMRAVRSPIAIMVALAVLAAACGGGGDEEPVDGGVEPAQDVAESRALLESVFFGGAQLGDYDRERLLAAAETLDPDSLCPVPAVPESLDDVAEVLRIDGGCAIIEYVALDGRSMREVRQQIFSSDSTAHAVGAPPKDLQPAWLQTGDPPDAYDDDGYGAGDWWHLGQLDAETLWDPEGWSYEDDSGQRRVVPGWPDDSEVVVAVLDTGTDEHRDLSGSFVEVAVGSWLAEACHREDTHGHGTHVSGLVAARQGNGQDVAGLAPEAKILPIHLLRPGACLADTNNRTEEEGQATTNRGTFDTELTATQAVRLAAEAGAKVINMSFTFGHVGNRSEVDDTDADTFEAVLDLVLNTYGAIPVAAAGNCGNLRDEQDIIPGCPAGLNTPSYPAAYRNVVSVAATRRTDSDDARASFSTRNQYVDVAAPGAHILSTVPAYTATSGDPCPTATTCHVQHFWGTSMAAPLMSSVIAHMMARYPQATVNEIAYALELTSVHPVSGEIGGPSTHEYGYGIVDPKAGMELLDRWVGSRPPRIPPVGPPDDDSPVSLAVGESAQGWEGCSSQHCRHLQITLNAPAGSYNVECWSSLDLNNPWHTDTWHWPTSGFWNESGCWYGYPGEQVWVTINGRKSNTITWPSSSEGGAPGEVPAPSSTFKTVTAGLYHSCAVRSDDTITCWGYNRHARYDAPSGTFKTVDAGNVYSCGLRTDDTITCWRGNIPVGQSDGPPDAPSGTFKTVAVGGGHACGLRSDDTITCWGWNRWGQTVAPSGTFKTVAAGGGHSCGLRSDDTITCWGYNHHGQTVAPSGTFKTVSAGGWYSCAISTDDTITCWGNNDGGPPDAPSGTFKTVDAGDGHSCAVRSDDTITCWGNNYAGQSDAPSGTFKTVDAGDGHSCAVRSDDTITCWGSNRWGQTVAPSDTFKTVAVGGWHSCGVRSDDTITCWGWNRWGQTVAPSGTFKTVAAGGGHSCGLRSDDTITCWGYNDGGSTDAPSGTFKTVDAGDGHSCGVRSDDTITCWGSNRAGQSDAPSGTFKTVTAGRWHSCGVRSDDTITCWGWNEYGQTVAPSGTFKTVDAGDGHSCGVRSDDTITCWGYNHHGQTVAPSGTFKTVAAGGWHSCGVRSDDTITCWGQNFRGQSDAPSGTFKTVTAGSLRSCGLRSDDTITCWGTLIDTSNVVG